VNLLFERIQPKIEEYNAGITAYNANLVGVGKQIDDVELNKLEQAASVCTPPVVVVPVRDLFQEINIQISSKTTDITIVLGPLKLQTRAILANITDTPTDGANSQRFGELKDTLGDIARIYQDIITESEDINARVSQRVDSYIQLFQEKQQEVLQNIRTQIAGLDVSDLPNGIDVGRGLLADIDNLLASVN
jgi:hypothetical protein